jgi:hypothetical protein
MQPSRKDEIWKPAMVKEEISNQSYNVETDEGKQFGCNRQLLWRNASIISETTKKPNKQSPTKTKNKNIPTIPKSLLTSTLPITSQE